MEYKLNLFNAVQDTLQSRPTNYEFFLKFPTKKRTLKCLLGSSVCNESITPHSSRLSHTAIPVVFGPSSWSGWTAPCVARSFTRRRRHNRQRVSNTSKQGALSPNQATTALWPATPSHPPPQISPATLPPDPRCPLPTGTTPLTAARTPRSSAAAAPPPPTSPRSPSRSRSSRRPATSASPSSCSPSSPSPSSPSPTSRPTPGSSPPPPSPPRSPASSQTPPSSSPTTRCSPPARTSTPPSPLRLGPTSTRPTPPRLCPARSTPPRATRTRRSTAPTRASSPPSRRSMPRLSPASPSCSSATRSRCRDQSPGCATSPGGSGTVRRSRGAGTGTTAGSPSPPATGALLRSLKSASSGQGQRQLAGRSGRAPSTRVPRCHRSMQRSMTPSLWLDQRRSSRKGSTCTT
jgi:hypothetical protein